MIYALKNYYVKSKKKEMGGDGGTWEEKPGLGVEMGKK